MRFDRPQSWTSNINEQYLPIAHLGEVVGFCKSNYAARLLETLNDDETLRKALQLACYDLVARSGGSSSQVNDLVQQYLIKAARPKQGVGAIALLLHERQEELDLTDDEFAKFCDTFRLSRQELAAIYGGQEVDSKHLTPLSRILGITVDELLAVWQGANVAE